MHAVFQFTLHKHNVWTSVYVSSSLECSLAFFLSLAPFILLMPAHPFGLSLNIFAQESFLTP